MRPNAPISPLLVGNVALGAGRSLAIRMDQVMPMIEFLFDPVFWATVAMLVGLELALGVDNVVFLSLQLAQLPEHQRAQARRFGLAISVLVQIILLYLMIWMTGVDRVAFTVAGWSPSWSQLAVLAGGSFLIYKGVSELHLYSEGKSRTAPELPGGLIERTFLAVLIQVAAINAVLSVDTIITAVGITRSVGTIVIAILATTAINYFASGFLTSFIARHRSIRALALALLIVVGGSLIAEGLGVAIEPLLLYAVFGGGTAVLAAIKLGEKMQTGQEDVSVTAATRAEPIIEPIVEPEALPADEINAPIEVVALEEPVQPVQKSAPKRRSQRRKASSKVKPAPQE